MKHLLPYALGQKPADIVIKNVTICNVFSLEYELADVAICGETIVGVGPSYTGETTIDGSGKVLLPGFIDGHIHIESSQMTPARFAEAVLPHGTTAIMADPHEIANVAGVAGILAMNEAAQELPLDIYLGAPACVPASSFETCYQPISADDLSPLFRNNTCHHLGEVMDFPAVISGEDQIWDKIKAATGLTLTAHAPGLSGPALCAYLLSGCDGDHETNSYQEGLEKLRRGMWLMARDGTMEDNLTALVPLLLENPARASRCMVVSDDISAKSIMEQGHMDAKLRHLIQAGLDPLIALRLVTLSPAEFFKLPRVGGIAPGWKADLVLADSLTSCRIDKVWKNGELVVDNGSLVNPIPSYLFANLPQAKLAPLAPEDILVPKQSGLMRAIGDPYSLTTKTCVVDPPLAGELVVASPARDIAKMVVRGRHHTPSRVGVGFVCGLGLREGAIGSSVAHDAHNFSAVGADDQSILTALEWLRKNGGGLVVAIGDKIIQGLPLPVAGLMSDKSAEEVASGLNALESAARNLGLGGRSPHMALSFLSLSVIPELKLTDQGYVDITGGGHQNLFC